MTARITQKINYQNFKFTKNLRHCERSEAIQITDSGLLRPASRFASPAVAVLAMTKNNDLVSLAHLTGLNWIPAFG
jgi:hypothetical protein